VEFLSFDSEGDFHTLCCSITDIKSSIQSIRNSDFWKTVDYAHPNRTELTVIYLEEEVCGQFENFLGYCFEQID
jgi:hypothetical protein